MIEMNKTLRQEHSLPDLRTVRLTVILFSVLIVLLIGIILGTISMVTSAKSTRASHLPTGVTGISYNATTDTKVVVTQTANRLKSEREKAAEFKWE